MNSIGMWSDHRVLRVLRRERRDDDEVLVGVVNSGSSIE